MISKQFKRVAEIGVGLSAITLLLLAGCGGSSGGGGSAGGGGTTAAASLSSALKPTFDAGNVVTTQFTRRDQSTISNVNVAYTLTTTGAPGFNDAKIAVNAGTIAAGATTGYSTALPSGSFNLSLSGAGLAAIAGTATTSAVNAVTGSGQSPEIIPATVTGATVTTYRAEEYQWTVTTPAASSVQVTIVQVDASGKPDYGSGKVMTNVAGANGAYAIQDQRVPYVVTAASSVAAGNLTSVQLNTELMPGSYKAYVVATNVSGVPVASSYISPNTITSSATTAAAGTPINVPVTLAAGKAVSLTLQNNAGTAIAGRWVQFYDAATWFVLGGVVTDATGTASIAVDSAVSNVIAQVFVGATNLTTTDTLYTFSNIPNTGATATLKQQTVSGAVTPNATCALTPAAGATTIGTIKVATPTSTTLPVFFSELPLAASATVATNGAYSLTLFGPTTGTGTSYSLSSTGTTSPGVDGCPDVAVTTTTVANAAVNQNLTAAGGGTIIGKVSTKAGAAVANMAIELWSGNKKVWVTKTDAAGNYQIPVAYGTYTLWAGSTGAAGFAAATGWSATEGISVSSGANNVTKNLTQYTLTGQVSKNMGGTTQASTSPTVNIGGLAVAASTLGVYSANVMEGKTWFCEKPGATETTYAYRCDLNVLVDAAAVTAAGQ